jgi:hypothetical protein
MMNFNYEKRTVMSTSSSAALKRQEAPETTETTNTELDDNVAAALSDVLGWITGGAMYLLEPDHETILFHAAQSIVVFGGFPYWCSVAERSRL